MTGIKKITIRDREAGNIIYEYNYGSIAEAEEQVREYEKEDKEDGIYVKNFYEITETV